jgi:tyrosine-protein phosphatase YwqE
MESGRRQEFLMMYVQAAVATGREAELLANLNAMNAPAYIYTRAASLLASAGKPQAALILIESVPVSVIVSDVQATADMPSVMQQAKKLRQQQDSQQANRCRTIASELAAIAKRATEAEDTAKAEEYTRQAEAFKTLADEMEK